MLKRTLLYHELGNVQLHLNLQIDTEATSFQVIDHLN